MKRKFLVAIAAASLYMGTASAMRPVTIVDQGSFFAGGTVAETPGRMDFQKPLNQHGQAGYPAGEQISGSDKSFDIQRHQRCSKDYGENPPSVFFPVPGHPKTSSFRCVTDSSGISVRQE